MASYRFNRLEIAGSLGDLGTLLPIAVGMILINGLNPSGVFASIGLFYILSGIYFKVTVPVQPMKVIGAYAIITGLDASYIFASGLMMAFFLLIIGSTGAIKIVGRYVTKPVVRGVQLSTGVLLMAQGVKFIIGTSRFQEIKQAAEPYLTYQSIGVVPICIVIGITGGLLTFLLLENRKLPAGLIVVFLGVAIGLSIGTYQGFENLRVGLYLPEILPFDFPGWPVFQTALLLLVLPQIPMTIGNAVIAYADLSEEYFGPDSKKVTYKSVCISMALANFLSFLLGGMPLCHGAGGLAAHYRFGARTAGSNLLIGSIFIILILLLGSHILSVLYLIPMSILGILLFFAGTQLALTIQDLTARKDLFTAFVILGITIATDLAAGFIAGVIVSLILKSDKLKV